MKIVVVISEGGVHEIITDQEAEVLIVDYDTKEADMLEKETEDVEGIEAFVWDETYAIANKDRTNLIYKNHQTELTKRKLKNSFGLE